MVNPPHVLFPWLNHWFSGEITIFVREASLLYLAAGVLTRHLIISSFSTINATKIWNLLASTIGMHMYTSSLESLYNTCNLVVVGVYKSNMFSLQQSLLFSWNFGFKVSHIFREDLVALICMVMCVTTYLIIYGGTCYLFVLGMASLEDMVS